MVAKYFEPNPCSSAGTPGCQKSLRGQAEGVIKVCPLSSLPALIGLNLCKGEEIWTGLASELRYRYRG